MSKCWHPAWNVTQFLAEQEFKFSMEKEKSLSLGLLLYLAPSYQVFCSIV